MSEPFAGPAQLSFTVMSATDPVTRAEVDAYRADTRAFRDEVAAKFERLDAKIDRIDAKVDRLDGDIAAIARKLFDDDDSDD